MFMFMIPDTIEDEVLRAKTDRRALNDFIESHRQWILKTASRSLHRYITESDDEWSVALMAFAEAIRSYEKDKGSFHAFASVVIKRRLLDYLRSKKRTDAETSVAPEAFGGELPEEEMGGVNLMVRQKVAEASQQTDTGSAAREEIEDMQRCLSAYGFSFFDLADCSPKAQKTKQSCADAIRILLGQQSLLVQMRRKKTLPMKELSEISGVSRKILDRHRKYIIAAAEILSGDFPILSSYISYIRKGV